MDAGDAPAAAALLFFSSFDRHPAIVVTFVTSLVPVVAPSAGWWLFDEPVTRPPVGGFVVIVPGFGLMTHRELRDTFEGRTAHG